MPVLARPKSTTAFPTQGQPLENLLKIQPNPAQIYPFGAWEIVHILSEKQDKLQDRARESILLTLPKSGHGWILYNPSTKIFFKSSSVTFVDYKFLLLPFSRKKGGLPFILIHLKLGEPSDLLIPKTICTALASSSRSEWLLTANKELETFEKCNVWAPVLPTKGTKVLGEKWVFYIKHQANGSIEIFKAHYVVHGFSQHPAVDCFDFYAPTASKNSLRLLLEMKVQYHMSLSDFDLSPAYLYSPIDEDIFVQAPVELWPEWNGKVMKLKKALYGIKEAATCWWKFSLNVMHRLGFEGSKVEPALYMFFGVMRSFL
ncbi:hypothetical protein O181_074555 [Austropuccinia psidii MF-1]|uniref:Reverse transcriptase Ty1/copia-type domain-containing protein n=1 Tax=Austropuccinia psidii MF-1 TaxID=1389203 RepID=A0A9Q3F4T6_9BASI|nr:hypothetical protein [Austropuccinia psidii MF-1]